MKVKIVLGLLVLLTFRSLSLSQISYVYPADYVEQERAASGENGIFRKKDKAEQTRYRSLEQLRNFKADYLVRIMEQYETLICSFGDSDSEHLYVRPKHINAKGVGLYHFSLESNEDFCLCALPFLMDKYRLYLPGEDETVSKKHFVHFAQSNKGIFEEEVISKMKHSFMKGVDCTEANKAAKLKH